jgi:hypothetical protein
MAPMANGSIFVAICVSKLYFCLAQSQKGKKKERKREKRKGGTTVSSNDTEIVSLCKSQNPRSPSMNLQDASTVPVDCTSTLGRQMTGSWWLLSQQLICIEI